MRTTEAPRRENRTELILLVAAERTAAERYAEWIAPEYETGIATSERDALAAIGRGNAVVVFPCTPRGVRPAEFLERARTAGYDGKVALVTDPRRSAGAAESEFDTVLSSPVSKSTLVETVDKLVRRVRYESRLDRHLSLARKRAKWEIQMPDDELETNNRYADLVTEQTRIETELDELLGTFETDDFCALFRGGLS